MFQHLLKRNDCYKRGRTIIPKGVMVHSTGANNPYLTRYIDDERFGFPSSRHWNQSGISACVHGFIGKMDNGTVTTCQTLPWNHRGWHCAGSGNNTHISFEICEDGLDDPVYFNECYKQAVLLTAYLCKKYNLDPSKKGVVVCHSEGHDMGIASNHADVMHWFPKFGKSMDTFRADVIKEMDEDEMTQEQWDKMMENWISRHSSEDAIVTYPNYSFRCAKVPISKFKIRYGDIGKRSIGKNSCNAGFFGVFDHGLTLPAGHLVCDFVATDKDTKSYCSNRGTIANGRIRWDAGGTYTEWGKVTQVNPQFYGKKLSTLVVKAGKATITDLSHAPNLNDCSYAISGVPIIRNDADVKFKTYVLGQGWLEDTLRPTYHTFIGLKNNEPGYVYVMAIRTTTPNCIYGMEAFKKLHPLGFNEVIKLDGGGSQYFNGNGRTTATSGNRRICTYIDFN